MRMLVIFILTPDESGAKGGGGAGEGEGWCFMPPRNARNPPYLLLPRGIEFIAGKNNPTDLPERQCGPYLFTAIPRFWYQLALWVFRDVCLEERG